MNSLPQYRKESRPWGNFEQFTKNENTTVKIISLSPDQQFSLQKHKQRKEFWRIIDGDGRVTIDGREFQAQIGSEFFVEQGLLHRAKAGAGGMRILEISFGEFEEEDIERVEDDYGRV